MPTNKLTDAQCRGLRAIDGAVKLFDGGGLYLHAMASGGEAFLRPENSHVGVAGL
jgi:hypothetical protein